MFDVPLTPRISVRPAHRPSTHGLITGPVGEPLRLRAAPSSMTGFHFRSSSSSWSIEISATGLEEAEPTFGFPKAQVRTVPGVRSQLLDCRPVIPIDGGATIRLVRRRVCCELLASLLTHIVTHTYQRLATCTDEAFRRRLASTYWHAAMTCDKATNPASTYDDQCPSSITSHRDHVCRTTFNGRIESTDDTGLDQPTREDKESLDPGHPRIVFSCSENGPDPATAAGAVLFTRDALAAS